MTIAKLKRRVSHKPSSVAIVPAVHAPLQPRSTLAEYVHRIGIVGQRIDAYVQFMSKMDEHAGLSDETKTRAAIVFCEKLIVVEQELGRIRDEYLLE